MNDEVTAIYDVRSIVALPLLLLEPPLSQWAKFYDAMDFFRDREFGVR